MLFLIVIVIVAIIVFVNGTRGSFWRRRWGWSGVVVGGLVASGTRRFGVWFWSGYGMARKEMGNF